MTTLTSIRPTRLAASELFFSLYLQCADDNDNSSDNSYVFFLYTAVS